MNILIEDISKTFTTSFTRKKVIAVKEFSLSIPAGEILGIIGPNGAGKSTVLKMILGFIRPDRGKILLMGKSPDDPSSRTRVGFLPENPYFYDHLSAEELMQFGGRVSGMTNQEITSQIDILLNLVELQSAKKRKLRSYSKGMIQRAGLCFALIHDPEVVVLDEPMSGLDPLGRKMVVDLILDLKKRGKTVLFCSHILSDVERICDRMTIMAKGKLQKILHQADLDKKAAMTQITLDRMTPRVSEKCREFNCDLKADDEHFVVEGGMETISMLSADCQREGIKIITTEDTAKNTLEQIFLTTIEDAEHDEANNSALPADL